MQLSRRAHSMGRYAASLPRRTQEKEQVMTTPSNTIVLIHGLWMTPLAWEHWVERYEARGFTVLTPGYPGIGQGEAGLMELRANPDAVAGVGVREIMDYLTDYITKLGNPPPRPSLAPPSRASA